MKQLLGIALILAVGLVVSHRWFGRAKISAYSRFYYLTGEEFLLLGLLLGPLVFNLIDPATLAGLEPFVGLGLGYIGFVFGMQFRREDLAAVPGSFYRGTAVLTLATGVALGFGLYFVLSRSGSPPPIVVAVVAALTATGLGTSTSFLFLVDRHTQLGRSTVFRFMRFSSVFDDLFGVVLFGVALCALRALSHPGGGTLAWLGVSVVLGLVCGAFLLAAVRLDLGDKEILLFLLGIVMFSGGLASYLRLSPVFTNTVAGLLFCNLSRESRSYHERLLRVEKPLYLFMMVLAGAMWKVHLQGLWIVVPVYVGFRLVGKYVGGIAVSRVFFGERGAAAFGLGLSAQSEMAVAMAVNLLLLYQDRLSLLAVTAVFASILVSDLVSSAYYSIRYRRA